MSRIAPLWELIEDGHQEGECFAWTSLRLDSHIVIFNEVRDGGFLHWSHELELEFLIDCFANNLLQTQFGPLILCNHFYGEEVIILFEYLK